MVYEISAFCFCKSKAPEVLMCVFVCVWGGVLYPQTREIIKLKVISEYLLFYISKPTVGQLVVLKISLDIEKKSLKAIRTKFIIFDVNNKKKA